MKTTKFIGDYLSHAELAAALKIEPKTLYQMNWAGTGPPRYKVGRSCRYDVEDVREWLQGRKR
ncbi:helix-turn-helix transcriptional regulator [Catenulispora rubra]|uniref:helix-turn-helix transcriptional regulator n=1 Tax=Catenulispora rubra TaxID=280293 RepID=UPI0034DD8F0C